MPRVLLLHSGVSNIQPIVRQQHHLKQCGFLGQMETGIILQTGILTHDLQRVFRQSFARMLATM